MPPRRTIGQGWLILPRLRRDSASIDRALFSSAPAAGADLGRREGPPRPPRRARGGPAVAAGEPPAPAARGLPRRVLRADLAAARKLEHAVRPRGARRCDRAVRRSVGGHDQLEPLAREV